MQAREKAVALAGAHGSVDMGTAGVEYCPMEDRATQRATILEHLQQHGSISTLEARMMYFIMSPASRIMELRRQGWCIITERDPRCKCARYHLQASDSDQRGEHHA